MIIAHNKVIPVVGTLLESLEQGGYPIESHCRQGFCGACRTKLSSGQVSYQKDPIGFCKKGEVLACCCTPVGDIELA